MIERRTLENFDEAIYWRGMIVQRYAAVEFSVTELITAAAFNPLYSNTYGTFPGKLSSRLHRLGELAKAEGPIKKHRQSILKTLEEFRSWEQHRHFFVHSLMVPQPDESILFVTYQHRDGQFTKGKVTYTIPQLRKAAALLADTSSTFPALVAELCRELSA